MTKNRTDKSQWDNLIGLLGGKSGLFMHYSELIDKYSEKWRKYHNLEHIENCLLMFDRFRDLSSEPEIVEIALWCHDVIYDTKSGENEEQSAGWCMDMMKSIEIPGEICERAGRLIIITKHREEPVDNDSMLMIDIDLSILGSPGETYDEYEKKIRAEYFWVPDDDFSKGRKAVLRSFLNRNTIFYTEQFINLYEETARVNIAGAIKKL